MGIWLLGQQVFRAGIADISGIANIADIADVADIGTDIADIAMGIADVVNSADIADRMLRTLRWKQVDAYKVSRGCPVTLLTIKSAILLIKYPLAYIHCQRLIY